MIVRNYTAATICFPCTSSFHSESVTTTHYKDQANQMPYKFDNADDRGCVLENNDSNSFFQSINGSFNFPFTFTCVPQSIGDEYV